MKAKRSTLIILLLMCISSLCSCGSSTALPMRESMVQVPARSNGTSLEEFLPSTPAEVTAEQLISSCTTHKFGEWTLLQTSGSGPWMETRRCNICGKTESRIAQDPVVETQPPAKTQSPAETQPPAETEPEQKSETPSKLGSAGMLSDKTVVVSIFVNDSTTHWDFDLKADKDMVNTMHRHLGNATKWITKQCKTYDVAAEFVYDWKKNPDLYYTYDFGQNKLVREDGSGYYTQTDYIDANIDTEALLKKYEAENIIYIFYFNTGKDNTINSWAITHLNDVYTEIINVYARDDYSGGFYIMPASSFAHEILHCFGAHDLYYASKEIPQAYVDHLEKTRSKDIMYTVGLGGSINQKFTELDAYYVGLVDSCDEVETWGLAKSTYLQ